MRHLKEFILDLGRWGVASEVAAFVFLSFAVYEHISGKTTSAFWFMTPTVLLFSLGAYAAWLKKAERVVQLLAEREAPNLYLAYDPSLGGKGMFGHSGLFLRTEGEKIASSVRITSPDTVGLSHSRLRIRWTMPGQNIGSQAVRVLFQCVTVRNEQETAYNSIEGEQLDLYFSHKIDGSARGNAAHMSLFRWSPRIAQYPSLGEIPAS